MCGMGFYLLNLALFQQQSTIWRTRQIWKSLYCCQMDRQQIRYTCFHSIRPSSRHGVQYKYGGSGNLLTNVRVLRKMGEIKMIDFESGTPFPRFVCGKSSDGVQA